MSAKSKSIISLRSESYLKYYKGINEAYQKVKSWEDVVASEYFWTDDDDSIEAFIDFVEDVYKTEVKDAKELDKLTGITALLPPEIGGDYILTSAKYHKYYKALEKTLREGGTYEDLLKIEPNEYKLPESWGVGLGKNKQETILWAISSEYLLDEPAGLMLLPSPRAIAKEIKAPYSVIMDAYNITRKHY